MTGLLFDPTATHDPERDVRDWRLLANRLGRRPNGCLHVLIAPKRAGKTWALRGVEALTGGTYIQLKGGRSEDWYALASPRAPVLVDEAVELIRREPLAFMRKCQVLSEEGRTVLAAMTPGDYASLRAADPEERFLDDKDRHFLWPLRPAEIKKLVGGAEWASTVAGLLPAGWKRNAYLLTSALHVAEQAPELRNDIEEITRQAIELAGDLNYVRSVAYEGLSLRQLSALRHCAGQSTPPRAEDVHVLKKVGLLSQDRPERIVDPILGDHFREALVIHHISDVHVGPKSAQVVDQKDRSPTGALLARAGGEKWLRDEYLQRFGDRDRPHIVALTGDLVEHGGNQEQLAIAVDWLKRLEGLLRERVHPDLDEDAPRLVVVGGNHDVDWQQTTVDQPSTTRHEPFAQALEHFRHPELHKAEGERATPYVHFPGARLSLLMLGSAEFGGQVNHRGEDVPKGDQWVDHLLGLLNATQTDEARTQLLRVLTDLGVDLERAGENLTVTRVDPGLVSKRALDRSVADRENMEPVCIGMLHHPLSPLPAAPEIAHYSGLTNAGQVKDTLFKLSVNLVLHGHQHQGFYAEERWPERHRNHVVRILAAPTLGSTERNESNGFNELRLFREGDALTAIEARRVTFQGARWVVSERPVRFLVPGLKAEEWKLNFPEGRSH